MENVNEIVVATIIATFIANFLLNTGRVLGAIKLCKEFLSLLNKEYLKHETKIFVSVYRGIWSIMLQGYQLINDQTNAIDCYKTFLVFLRACDERAEESKVTIGLARLYHFQSKYKEAMSLFKKGISIAVETGERQAEAMCYVGLGSVYQSLNNYRKAKECLKKALVTSKEIGDREGEAECYENLAPLYHSVGEYDKAVECQKKALAINEKTGDRRGEATCYGSLGTIYWSLGEYGKAEEYQNKALVINKEIGDRAREASCYGSLGTVYHSLGKYGKAEEYEKKALVVRKEIGDRKGEAACYGNLGAVYQSLCEYGEAEEHQRKALAIRKEIGDRPGEALCYESLATLYQSLCEYGKAEDYEKKALVIRTGIGDRAGEATCYGNLGTICVSLSEYCKAEEYGKKALVIREEIGDRAGEATCYGNLGAIYEYLGEHDKAAEYEKKALVIRKEIGDRKGEALCCGNLGTVFQSLGQYGKSEEYQNKALEIRKEIGDRKGEADCYGSLGFVYESLCEYSKAEEYRKKALEIIREIGDRKGEAESYEILGAMCESLREHGKAEQYHKKALLIAKEIGDRKGEAASYRNLGGLFRSLGKHAEAKEYHKKALAISKDIGDKEEELTCHYHLACDMLSEGNITPPKKVFSDLFASIEKCEELRSFLRDHDRFKISLLDRNKYPYLLLSALLWKSGNPSEALCVIELGRARALADLMSAQYSVQQQLLVNPQSWVKIEKTIDKDIDCTYLNLSYCACDMVVLVLKANKPILVRQTNVNECFVKKGSERDVDEVFSEETLSKFRVLPQEHCEDRSLFLSNPGDLARESSQQDSMAGVHLKEDDEDENQQPVPTLAECYQMIIAPVADLLEKPEIVIVPDPLLYKVSFAALKDESGKYLSESYWIRIAPSLTTLKLIQDSPADYHSKTGALIVGEPDVGDVLYKGRKEKLCPLPCARREAEMIGRLLGIQPLLGKQATKQAVLQSIHSVSLIHFAAHGNAERGEIALAPQSAINATPSEEDYLLTMVDISQVRLRAKLVVLSCCHTARGQIRSEGVVGIARAFLGSGARSVLVALWALGDSATEQLMSRFYERLVCGESASESLHQVMKWMRSNGYPDVRDWAPFMLIGDNVTFDFW